MIACVTFTIHQCETGLVRQVHHPRALQFPREGWTTHFPSVCSSRLLAPKTGKLDKSQSTQSIPLQAPMRGKCCARRYMQTLPRTSPNSAAIYRRNCREHFQWSHLYMCCSMRRPCTAPWTCRILAYTKSDTNHACPPQDQRRAPRNDANVRRNCNMYVHAIYHLASALCACMQVRSGHPDVPGCWYLLS